MSTVFIDYLPAELRENKEWYVRYYVKNPATEKLHLKKVKLTRIKSIKERRKYGKRLVLEINKKLEQGWNPFLEQESAKSYHNIYEVFETYLNVKGKELRSQSMRTYNSNMKILMEYLTKRDKDKKMYILSFDKQIANDFMNYMYIDRNVSERRYNGILIFCKSVFGWMLQYSYVKANPFDGIKKKKEQAKKREFIPNDVRVQIKNHLEEENFEFLVFLMLEFYALLRPNEILNLKIKDIDIEKQVIAVAPEIAKNGKFRLSTIPDNLIEYLKRLNLENYKPDLYIFSDDLKPGKSLKLTKFAGRRWLKLRKDLSLKKEYQMYSLRDSGIINLLQSGVSPEEVAKQAAHSSLEITSKYAIHANKEANEQVKVKALPF